MKFLSLVVGCACVAFGLKPSTTPLNQWPMVMAHDAATTYLKGGSSILHPINTWAKTQQDGGPSQELVCGARAFDWRPQYVNGSLIMHHGGISINVPMKTAIADIISWANANGTALQDFVLLVVSHCSGDGCQEESDQLLTSMGIKMISNCSQLEGLTIEDAYKMGALAGGGSVLAIYECYEGHYVDTIACTGTHNLIEYTCYVDSTSKLFPLQRMWDYLANVSAQGPTADGRPYTHQALWQETTESVAVSELYGSSLLYDELWSNLNHQVAQRIKNGQLDSSRINMVEVNNVCDGGLELLEVLRALT